MSQVFKGDVTNNVVELNLQAGATNIGTPTVAYDGANNGEIAVQVMGDVDEFSGFENDSTLKGLVIGTSCINILSATFDDCTGLTGSLTIPDSVTSIGYSAFLSCTGFTGSLTIPDSVESIEDGAFSFCSGFTGGLNIGTNANLTTLPRRVFLDCSGLTGAIEIPSNITVIDNNAFNGCSSFTSLILHDDITRIGISCFSGCSNVSGTLSLPANLTALEQGAFINCQNLTGSLVIPSGVATVGGEAFASCGFNGTLDLNNAISIGGGAFGYCSFTGTLDIPDSVTTIGGWTFRDNNFTAVTIGSGLAAIPNGFVAFCASVTDTLVLPATVSSVGNNAFNGCAFTRIEYYRTSPPAQGISVFAGGFNTTVIHVPAGSDWVEGGTWNGLTIVKDL